MQRGREALDEVNIHGVKKQIIEMLGRLHYRTSYSQNVLRHSIEVAFLSGMLAEMMGLDPELAKRAGLMHDIGKAADHEIEGGHPKVGADMLKRAGESEEVPTRFRQDEKSASSLPPRMSLTRKPPRSVATLRTPIRSGFRFRVRSKWSSFVNPDLANLQSSELAKVADAHPRSQNHSAQVGCCTWEILGPRNLKPARGDGYL